MFFDKIRNFWNEIFHSSDIPIKKEVSYFDLYKYATTLDKICIIIGICCAVTSGTFQPFLLMFYGYITEDLVLYVTKVYNTSMELSEKHTIDNELNANGKKFIYCSLIVGIWSTFLLYFAGVLLNYTAIRQITKMRIVYIENLLNQDIEWHDLHKTSELSSIFLLNMTKIHEAIGEKLIQFAYFCSVFTVAILLSLVMGWKFTIVCMISLPASLMVVGFVTWVSSKLTVPEMKAYAYAGGIAEEVFSAIKTVVAFERQKKEANQYINHLIYAKENNIRKGFFQAISNGFTWFFIYSGYALAFYYGVSLIINDRINIYKTYSIGNVIAIFSCSLLASWNFGLALPTLHVFSIGKEAAEDIFYVLTCKPKINKSKGEGVIPKFFDLKVVFQDVYFSYPSRPEVLIMQGLNLSISYGETVAIVGPSGCGKTTCLDLVSRLYDVTSGNIFIGDNDIRELDLTWLRNNIGVLRQNSFLFETSIAENIRYGKASATQDEIVAAAKSVKIHDFIYNLPNGYQTIINVNSNIFSIGQLQKIAIARALIKKPELLLLDEVAYPLDASDEAEVQEALEAIRGTCTTIIVAHSLSTFQNVNKIFYLSDGHIVEEGTHVELVTLEGLYYKELVSQGLIEVIDDDSGEMYALPYSSDNPKIPKFHPTDADIQFLESSCMKKQQVHSVPLFPFVKNGKNQIFSTRVKFGANFALVRKIPGFYPCNTIYYSYTETSYLHGI